MQEVKNRISIKDWSKDDRPREKLILKGTEALSDSELIAILLSSGNKRQTAVELARDILKSCDNKLNVLGKKTYKDLMKFNGIGEAKAISVVAALELGKRRKLEEFAQSRRLSSSKDVFNFFQPLLADLSHEEFWIALLNNSNTVIDIVNTSKGGTTSTIFDIKIICREAITNLAQGLILVHNHPSGNLKPSEHDINLTNKINEAVKLFDIKVLDHVIITERDYYSFADNGML